MSDKGYDSDAQCISTPKQIMVPSEHPHLAVSIRQNMSPLRNTYQAGKPTQEEVGDPADAQQKKNKNTSDSQQPLAHIDWPPQSLRGATEPRCATSPVASPVSNAPSCSVRDENAEPSGPASVSEKSGISAGIGKAVTTPTPDTNGVKPRFYAAVAQHGFRGINPVHHAHAPYTTSSESLAGHGMGITVAKKRQPASQETSSEVRSLHLGDMNISKVLASTSTSPRVLSKNPSIDEGGQWNKHSVRSVSDQYHECVARGRISTPLWGRDGLCLEIPHRRETSSFYSPKSSISAAGISRDLQFPGLVGKAVSSPVGSDRHPSTTEIVPASSTSGTSQPNNDPNSATTYEHEPQTDAVRSKFVEEFGINRSISSGSIEALPPRKVSIGWMSGGRRLGYGYTLVSDDEDRGGDKDQEAQTVSNPNAGSENIGRANGAAIETTAQESDKPPSEQHDGVSLSFDNQLRFSADQAFTSQLSLRRWSGATALMRVTKPGDPTDRSPAASSFWERFTRRNDQDDSWWNEAKIFRRSFFGTDLEQAGGERKRSSTWFETGNRSLLDRHTGMRFPLDSALDQHDVAGEQELEAQAGPDAIPSGSLRRPRGKFRVLNRRKRGNNRSNSDRRTIFPIKHSIWAADSGLMSRGNMHTLARLGSQDSSADFSPGQHTPKRSMRIDPDTIDQSSLEMHSEPE